MGVYRTAQLTAAMTLLLLIAGGLVTSTDSGLAVPDWPLSYGQFFPPMVGGIFYEHGHRMLAAVVGILIAVLAVWLWLEEPRRWVRRLGYSVLLAVVAQALLGGLTVLRLLPPAVSMAHACLGPLVFCLVVCLAMVTSPTGEQQEAESLDPALRRLSVVFSASLFGQLLLGAVIRHSGRAVIWHVLGALVVSMIVAALLVRVVRSPRRPPRLSRLVIGLALGLGLQVVLGIMSFLHPAHVAFTTAHAALGSVLLAGACALSLIVCRSGIGSLGSKARQRLPAYLALTKPRLTALAVLTTGVGFLMGSLGSVDWLRLIATLCGSALVGAGANALNQWAERHTDALMSRTKSRPLPSGRLAPVEALGFGLVTSALGLCVLAWFVNALATGLALITLISYLGIYTPLKRKTALCTLVGAIPGALPPMIGWAAARGGLSLEAWVLFAMVFLWQLPHFLAIAWMYREDYARAGFQMLPVVDLAGSSTARQMVLYGLALLPTSLLPTILGLAGPVYFLGVLCVGCWFVTTALLAARIRSLALAKRLFLASVGYLPAVLVLMVMDKTPF